MSTLVGPAASQISDLFEWLDLNRPSSLSDLIHHVPVESFTDHDRYVVRADLPGIEPQKDVEVTVDGDVLTIHAERREEQHDRGHSEVRYGSFHRSVRLPEGAVAREVAARYDAGVLEVVVPLSRTPAEPVTVTVQATEGSRS